MDIESIRNDFQQCNTIKEAKRLYHQYSRLYHPDVGGTNEDMQILIKIFNEFKPNPNYKTLKIKFENLYYGCTLNYNNVTYQLEPYTHPDYPVQLGEDLVYWEVEPSIEVSNNDIYYTHKCSILDSILQTKQELLLLRKKITFVIPSLTSPKKVISIAKQGWSDGNILGNLIIKFEYKNDLTNDELLIIETLKAARNKVNGIQSPHYDDSK